MTTAAMTPTGPLRIGLVEFYGVGGTADYTDCLAQALAARGHHVAVITSSLFEPLESTPSFDVMPVFRYRNTESKPRKAIRLARSLGAAGKALRAFRPDVVHAQGTVMPIVERQFYPRISSSARVCTVHDVQGHEWRPWLGSYSRYYRGFDALVCHSQASRQRLRDLLPGTSVTVIPHGRYTPLASTLPTADAARADLNLPNDAHVVLLFGFLRRYKGVELFLEAMRLVQRSAPGVIGVIAGRPLYDVTAMRRASEREHLPVRWDLRFIPRSEISRYFAAADVVALPYRGTSDSGMIELAAAFRKPVVTTSVGGLGEAFTRYGVGALVPPDDPSALALAMARRYPSDPAPDDASASWEQVAIRHESLYRDLIKTSTARARSNGSG
jgi:D-inositol-3-phosphate glycosyltransferase